MPDVNFAINISKFYELQLVISSLLFRYKCLQTTCDSDTELDSNFAGLNFGSFGLLLVLGGCMLSFLWNHRFISVCLHKAVTL